MKNKLILFTFLIVLSQSLFSLKLYPNFYITNKTNSLKQMTIILDNEHEANKVVNNFRISSEEIILNKFSKINDNLILVEGKLVKVFIPANSTIYVGNEIDFQSFIAIQIDDTYIKVKDTKYINKFERIVGLKRIMVTTEVIDTFYVLNIN